MIEQLQYATTSRYNFPQTISDLPLPKKIVELSINSMEHLKGESFQPSQAEFPTTALNKQGRDDQSPLNGKALTAQLTPLKPISDDTPIMAVDVSSIKIGETETGVLCAIRGAVIQNRKRQYRYFRFGPFPFHLDEENNGQVIHLLRQYGFPVSGSSNAVDMLTKLCDLVEKWIQMEVCSSSKDSIILWDGSLTASPRGNPLDLVSHLLKASRQRFNSVLAFSKMTKIRVSGRRITDSFSKYPPPWLFEVQEIPPYPSLHFLGDVYIARFRNNGYSFRLDIDKAVPIEERIDAVQKLIGNDLVFQSYPESLRLAHIYSTFTANEVIGIQHYIAQKFNLKASAQPNIRKALFGPFGTRFND